MCWWDVKPYSINQSFALHGVKHNDFCSFKGVTYNDALTLCYKLIRFLHEIRNKCEKQFVKASREKNLTFYHLYNNNTTKMCNNLMASHFYVLHFSSSTLSINNKHNFNTNLGLLPLLPYYEPWI